MSVKFFNNFCTNTPPTFCIVFKTGSEQLDLFMTVTLSGCRMSKEINRYTHTQTHTQTPLQRRSHQRGPPSPTSHQTFGGPLSFLRGVPVHQFLARAQIASCHPSLTSVEGVNILLASFWPLGERGDSVENIALDCKFQEGVWALRSVQRVVREQWEKDQAYYQRRALMESLFEAYVSESHIPSLEWLWPWSPELQRPETPESAALREQPSATVPGTSVVGALVRHLLHHTQQWGELRRQHFGDRSWAPWEDPYSCLLGAPVEHSAGNFLWTMGTVPAGGFRDSGISSLVPRPGSSAQRLRAPGWRTSPCLPPLSKW